MDNGRKELMRRVPAVSCDASEMRVLPQIWHIGPLCIKVALGKATS